MASEVSFVPNKRQRLAIGQKEAAFQDYVHSKDGEQPDIAIFNGTFLIFKGNVICNVWHTHFDDIFARIEKHSGGTPEEKQLMRKAVRDFFKTEIEKSFK